MFILVRLAPFLPVSSLSPISFLSNRLQTKIADLVQIHPQDLEKSHAQVIEDNINAKYANKVIQKIGLCICLYDLLYASDGQIGNGTGLVNINGIPPFLFPKESEREDDGIG